LRGAANQQHRQEQAQDEKLCFHRVALELVEK
jgi:hypothetical protein